MMFSNKVKAVGLFVVVLYALYGGELVNVSRDPRRGSGGGGIFGGGGIQWTQERPGWEYGTSGRKGSPVDITYETASGLQATRPN